MVSKTTLEKREQRKSNEEIVKLVNLLKKQQSPLWKTVAKLLTKPTRRQIVVNIEKINRMSKGDAVVIVPGKILSKGDLENNTTIVAFKFSETAKQKLAKKANLMNFQEFIKKQNDFKGIPIKIIT
ncbi:MAG: 50S ribosomal protein L18e [Candidatus Pacearchaeota archaeon]